MKCNYFDFDLPDINLIKFFFLCRICSSKPSLAYQSKLQALKQFMEQKDEGQSLLNEAVNAGDALVPNITSEDKVAIRAVLHRLRDNWETHLDQVQSLYFCTSTFILPQIIKLIEPRENNCQLGLLIGC